MMNNSILHTLLTLLNKEAIPCDLENKQFYEKLSNMIGDARIVLMGEATHGTSEFYQARMELSLYLIQQFGFHAIAIEGDWTSVFSANCYIQGKESSVSAEKALEQFKRFPEWMWRNKLMSEFLKKLRQYNDLLSDKLKISIYGLDLYCLTESLDAVIHYLKKHYPKEAEKAIERYACFDHVKVDPQAYSYLVEHHVKASCTEEVKAQLMDIQHLAYQNIAFKTDEFDQAFYAIQNARVVKNAENYYRALFGSHHLTWNIRDQHMADTLQNIIAHIESKIKEPAKVIIWAHNSHVGDARATEMSEKNEINLGQLVRERFNTSTYSLGFSTAIGTVTAASEWGGAAMAKNINAPIAGSYEALFHQAEVKNFILDLRRKSHLTHLLNSPQLQRAIGVIYRPETERMSHYFFTHLPYQFDSLIHLDNTNFLKAI